MKKLALIICMVLCSNTIIAQRSVIKSPRGYSNNIGQMISMLDNLKARVVRNVINLDQQGTDFLLDENANAPGAIIYHLAATEAYYQVYTFEKRGFNQEEREKWEVALNLGPKARAAFKNKPISYYLELYDEVREKTKKLLKEKDDDWFEEMNGGMNNHWAWFHVMEHQANHMGQLALITKRIK